MDRFQSLSVFAKVVEQGGFARAAERLQLSASAVSRHVAELESHLGVRLLNRTTRKLSLTESGQAFHERTVQLLADLEEAEVAVASSAMSPRGTLRLTCPIAFGEWQVAPAIAAFSARYPQLKFDVELSDRMVDLVEEGFDLAIRIGSSSSQALIARRIGETRLVCVASPAYLARHGAPKVPQDLARHRCVVYANQSPRDAWRFADARGVEHVVRIAGPAMSNNGRFLAALATCGMAISMEPDIMVRDELKSGRLVELLASYRPPAIPIHAVYPSRRHLSAKVRLFVDFIAQRFAGENADGRVAGRSARTAQPPARKPRART